jgi:hypothetical protein
MMTNLSLNDPIFCSDFKMPFTIQLMPPLNDNNTDGDDRLPTARACFFTLNLPRYNKQEVITASSDLLQSSLTIAFIL